MVQKIPHCRRPRRLFAVAAGLLWLASAPPSLASSAGAAAPENNIPADAKQPSQALMELDARQWRSDNQEPDRIFSFMGFTLGQQIEEAKQRLPFQRCTFPQRQSLEGWGIVSANGALVLYVADGKVGGMQFFFPANQAKTFAKELFETYGKPSHRGRTGPRDTGLGRRYGWNIPKGSMVYTANVNRIGVLTIISDGRIEGPGFWVDCGAGADSVP